MSPVHPAGKRCTKKSPSSNRETRGTRAVSLIPPKVEDSRPAPPDSIRCADGAPRNAPSGSGSRREMVSKCLRRRATLPAPCGQKALIWSLESSPPRIHERLAQTNARRGVPGQRQVPHASGGSHPPRNTTGVSNDCAVGERCGSPNITNFTGGSTLGHAVAHDDNSRDHPTSEFPPLMLAQRASESDRPEGLGSLAVPGTSRGWHDEEIMEFMKLTYTRVLFTEFSSQFESPCSTASPLFCAAG